MTTINDCLDLLSRASDMLSEASNVAGKDHCYFCEGIDTDACPYIEWKRDFSALIERIQREQNDKGAT